MQFKIDGSTLIKVYPNNETKIEVSDTVHTIAPGAFSLCSKVTNFYLPDTIDTLPESCFRDLKSALLIQLPKNLKVIGDYAFYGVSVSKFELPDSVQVVGRQAFANNKFLTEIRWPASIQSIGWCALDGCSALKNVIVSDELLARKSFLSYYSCFNGLEEIVLPDTVERIEDFAFQDCEMLKKIVIPPSVKYIGQYAFDLCNAIQEIQIPQDCVLGNGTFNRCRSLRKLTMSRSSFLGLKLVNEAEIPLEAVSVPIKPYWLKQQRGTFLECNNLKRVTLYKNEEAISKARQQKLEAKLKDQEQGIWEDPLFRYQDTDLGTDIIKCKRKRIKEITIPSNIHLIQENAFSECDPIDKVILEEGLNNISTRCFSHVKVGTINIPCSLTSLTGADFNNLIYYNRQTQWSYFPGVTIPDNHPKFQRNGRFYSEKTPEGLKLIYFLPFEHKDIVVPEGITVIGSHAMKDVNSETLTFPSSLRRIETSALENADITTCIISEGCLELEENWLGGKVPNLQLPASLKSVGKLGGLARLSTVLCPVNTPAYEWAINRVGKTHIRLTKHPTASRDMTTEVFWSGEGAQKRIAGYDGFERTLHLADLIPDDMVYVEWPPKLFRGHKELEEVWLPEGMKVVPSGFFANCRNLRKVHFSSTVTEIAANVFSGCPSLTELFIPAAVTVIDPMMFGTRNASIMRSITLQGAPESAAEAFAKDAKCLFEQRFEGRSRAELEKLFGWTIKEREIDITDIRDSASTADLIIPDSIEGIPVTGVHCSSQIQKRKLVIGKNVRSMRFPFNKCTDIQIHPENNRYLVEDGLFYALGSDKLISVLPQSQGKTALHVREGTVHIDSIAFSNCTQLHELYLPRTLANEYDDIKELHSSWDDPLIIYGYPNTEAATIALKNRSVYVDQTLTEQEKQLCIDFKMMACYYTFNDGRKTTYGYVTHGYAGKETNVKIPAKIGNMYVTCMYGWYCKQLPDTVTIPKTMTDYMNVESAMAKKAIIVEEGHPKYLSVGGQLYDMKQRMLKCPEQCDANPAMENVRITCDGSCYQQHRHEMVLTRPLQIIGNMFEDGHLDRLVVKAEVHGAVIDPGTIDTVVVSESLAPCARFFHATRWISVVNEQQQEICFLASSAFKHAAELDKNPYLLLEGHSYNDYLKKKITLDLPWLIRRHDEAFEDMHSTENKIRMSLARLLTPYLLSEEHKECYHSYLSRSARKCVELLCEDDDFGLFRKFCQLGITNKRNVKKLVEITTERGKTEWTATLLRYAMQP